MAVERSDSGKLQTVTLGIEEKLLSSLMQEWTYRGCPGVLKIRRAKTKGWVVVQTTMVPDNDVQLMYFFSWVAAMYVNSKVDIRIKN